MLWKQSSMAKLSIPNVPRSSENLFQKNTTRKSCFYWFSYRMDVLLNVKLVIQYLSSVVYILLGIRSLLRCSLKANFFSFPFEHRRNTANFERSPPLHRPSRVQMFCVLFLKRRKWMKSWANVWRIRRRRNQRQNGRNPSDFRIILFFCFTTHLLFHSWAAYINLKQWALFQESMYCLTTASNNSGDDDDKALHFF